MIAKCNVLSWIGFWPNLVKKKKKAISGTTSEI